MCEHKIEDYTFVLYNIMLYNENKNNCTECDNLQCKWGNCICIDHEQTGLLRRLLSEEDQIAFSFDNKRSIFLNLQNRLRREDLCQQSEDELYHNRFSSGYEEIVNQLIEAYRVSNLHLLDVIKALPIQYATNSLHGLEERNPLLFLCKYAPCSEKYLSILFRALICKTIGCCKRAKIREEKEAYAKELVKLLNHLKAVLDKDDKQVIHQCMSGANRFISKWSLLKSKSCKILKQTIENELMVYLENLADSTENFKANQEAGRHHQMYCLLKKILETADINTEDLPKLPFAEYENAADIKTDYDTVIEILDCVKQSTDKLAKIWTILSRIFWSGEDIPTDELENIKQIAYH